MDSTELLVWMSVGGVALLVLPAVAIVSMYTAVRAGEALVVNKLTNVQVYFTGAMFVPWMHRAERVDMSRRALTLTRSGKDGLSCKDGIRADVAIRFRVGVRKTHEDVLHAVHTVGAARAADLATLEELFTARFVEAMATVAKQLDFGALAGDREAFRDRVVEAIGDDLGGYAIDDAAVERLEQTPIAQLDPDDILDAKGIRKITEATTAERLAREEVEHRARARRLELDRLVADLEHRKADALGRFARDVGRELTEAQLRERLAALVVEHFGPAIDATQAKARVAEDPAAVPS